VILDASYRRPPFQLGEKEKGFRDALILETFLQIVKNSPTSRSLVRIALVSSDQLLRDAALSRLPSAANVHFLESVDALKGLINTIGSAVDEQFIAAIKERAADIFFKSGDENTLYQKESIGARLESVLKNATQKLPLGAYRYRVDKWTISAPRFVKKQGQRIYWATRFDAALNALKAALTDWGTGMVPLANLNEPSFISPNIYLNSLQLNSASGAASPDNLLFSRENPQIYNSLAARVYNPAEDQVVGYGTASLDASWSLAVTTSGALTKPRLESVDFVEVVWTSAS
jgi:hypothetical protein